MKNINRIMRANPSNRLNESRLSNKSNKSRRSEFTDMDINRIRDFINILEEHQVSCEKQRHFVEAEIAKQKVKQLKKVEKDKLLADLSITHSEELESFEADKKNTFQEFNKVWDENLKELLSRFVEFEQKLNLQQQNDLNERVMEFDKKYPPMIKPNSEILNLNKMLSGLVRQKEYIKAHQIQSQIDALSNVDNSKYLEQKERSLMKEIEKIKRQHQHEFEVLKAKRDLAKAEYEKNRELEYKKMMQSFKNRYNEISMQQNFEKSQILNPKLYRARNLNRSLQVSRVHSASNIGERNHELKEDK